MPRWIRVRDHDTKHEFDLNEDDSRITDGLVEVIKDYEPNEGLTAQPRPPKIHVALPRAEKPTDQSPAAPAAGNPPAEQTAKNQRSK